MKSETYHYDRAEAPLLTLALLEADQTEHTKHLVFDPDEIPYTVAIDLESTNANNNHDPVAIARPPQPIQAAEQVIGLDATGSQDWWELITGVDFEVISPNPLDKRGTVVTEAFDIEFRQLAENMVPINRPDNLSAREFLGIVQAVADEHDAEEVSIVTSKAMKRKIENSGYAEEVMELAYADTILYFNGLRSDRTFEKSRLHVVIGAPHLSDDAVRQWMALLRYDDRIVQTNSTLRGEDRYQGDARRALENIVYSEIYQAARRAARDFDRDETAYVYLYARMFDNTLLSTDDRYSVEIFGQGEKRDGSTEAILAVLDKADRSITTTKIDER